jgi:hypothetical protein
VLQSAVRGGDLLDLGPGPRRFHAPRAPLGRLPMPRESLMAVALSTIDEALEWGVANPVSWLVVCGCGGVVMHGLYSRRMPGLQDLLVLYVWYSTLSGGNNE